MSEIVTRGQVINASGGILNERELAKILKEIEASPKLGGKAETVINQALLAAFQKHRGGMAMMEGEPFPFQLSYVEEAYDGLVAQMGKAAKNAGKPLNAAQKTIEELKVAVGATNPLKKRGVSFLENLSNEQKVHGGLWMLSAALCAFGTFSAARGIIQKDEDGKNHIQPTAVGITMLQGLLTAGSVYLGASALRGRG